MCDSVCVCDQWLQELVHVYMLLPLIYFIHKQAGIPSVRFLVHLSPSHLFVLLFILLSFSSLSHLLCLCFKAQSPFWRTQPPITNPSPLSSLSLSSYLPPSSQSSLNIFIAHFFQSHWSLLVPCFLSQLCLPLISLVFFILHIFLFYFALCNFSVLPTVLPCPLFGGLQLSNAASSFDNKAFLRTQRMCEELLFQIQIFAGTYVLI